MKSKPKLNASTPAKRVLVVTDRYPPEVVGGAEISLSLVLQPLLKKNYEIFVATLSGNGGGGKPLDHEGVSVYRLPNIAAWPYMRPYFSLGGTNTKLQQLARLFSVATSYCTKSGQRSRIQRLKALLLHLRLSRKRLGGWFPLMDLDLVDFSPTSNALQNVFDQIKPDMIHADNYRGILFAANISRGGTPFIAHVRDNRFLCSLRDQPTNIAGKICKSCDFECLSRLPTPHAEAVKPLLQSDQSTRRSSLGAATAIIATSHYLESQIKGLDCSSNVFLVPNPADNVEDVDRIQQGITRADPPEILVVGMINHNKGQRHVARWITELKRHIPDFKIVLAGRGGMLERIRMEVAANGDSDYLATPGFLGREALYRCYARSSVVVAPNVWPEPFGRVPLEAALSRRPTVAYGFGGPAQTIIHGKTGFLVEPQNEEALLATTRTLLANPQLASEIGDNARNHVISTYSVEQSTSALEKVWQSVTER